MNKRSKQREAVIRVLRSTSSHPDAKWIYEEVKREIPDISLATVYRNLRLLRESGEVAELPVTDNAVHFDYNTENHYHLRCDRCGRILDLDAPVDRSIEEKLAGNTGLKVTHHHLELGGLCLDCQKIENSNREELFLNGKI